MVIIIKKSIKEFLLLLNTLFFICLFLLIFNFKLFINNDLVTVSQLSCDAVVVMNGKTKEVLYQKNAYTPKLTASICKVVTAYTAIKYIPLDKYVYINEKMIDIEGSKIYLEAGDLVSVETLIYGLMLRSGNDAAKSLALAYSGNETDFIYLMNKMVKDLGLTKSIFHNPSGLDSQSENYSSCYDLAYFTSVALENKTFKKIFTTKYYKTIIPSGKEFYFINKHRLVMQEKASQLGGKTGYTKKAGRTLITAFDIEDNPIIVVTMDAYNDWNIHRFLAEKYGKSV